jgi:hypothetical protein
MCVINLSIKIEDWSEETSSSQIQIEVIHFGNKKMKKNLNQNRRGVSEAEMRQQLNCTVTAAQTLAAFAVSEARESRGDDARQAWQS